MFFLNAKAPVLEYLIYKTIVLYFNLFKPACLFIFILLYFGNLISFIQATHFLKDTLKSAAHKNNYHH